MNNKISNEYFFSEDESYIILEIRGGKYEGDTFIDIEDYEKIQKYKWNISHRGYAYCTNLNGYWTLLHKFITSTNENQIVDHDDRNKLNNIKNNLSIVTPSENSLNRPKSDKNTSGRTGVRYKKRKRRSDCWVGQYDINGKRYEKSFSIDVYGYNEAYNMALQFREEGEIKYNIKTEK